MSNLNNSFYDLSYIRSFNNQSLCNLKQNNSPIPSKYIQNNYSKNLTYSKTNFSKTYNETANSFSICNFNPISFTKINTELNYSAESKKSLCFINNIYNSLISKIFDKKTFTSIKPFNRSTNYKLSKKNLIINKSQHLSLKRKNNYNSKYKNKLNSSIIASFNINIDYNLDNKNYNSPYFNNKYNNTKNNFYKLSSSNFKVDIKSLNNEEINNLSTNKNFDIAKECSKTETNKLKYVELRNYFNKINIKYNKILKKRKKIIKRIKLLLKRSSCKKYKKFNTNLNKNSILLSSLYKYINSFNRKPLRKLKTNRFRNLIVGESFVFSIMSVKNINHLCKLAKTSYKHKKNSLNLNNEAYSIPTFKRNIYNNKTPDVTRTKKTINNSIYYNNNLNNDELNYIDIVNCRTARNKHSSFNLNSSNYNNCFTNNIKKDLYSSNKNIVPFVKPKISNRKISSKNESLLNYDNTYNCSNIENSICNTYKDDKNNISIINNKLNINKNLFNVFNKEANKQTSQNQNIKINVKNKSNTNALDFDILSAKKYSKKESNNKSNCSIIEENNYKYNLMKFLMNKYSVNEKLKKNIDNKNIINKENIYSFANNPGNIIPRFSNFK